MKAEDYSRLLQHLVVPFNATAHIEKAAKEWG
jgi:hypothetical protein